MACHTNPPERTIHCLNSVVRVRGVGPVGGGILLANYFRVVRVAFTGDVRRDLVLLGEGDPDFFVARALMAFGAEDKYDPELRGRP